MGAGFPAIAEGELGPVQSLLEKTRLPEGFRDFGPEAAQAITNLGARLDRLYSRWGFRRVLTPSIETEEVIAPGLGARAAEGAFRIVDPLTGQVLLFRPDITPQVARLVATGAAGRDLPIKLFYRGSVVRRTAQASHGSREVYQSGVENLGADSAVADAETLALALECAGEARVSGAVLELGDVRFVEGILGDLALSPGERAFLTSAIDRKARAEIGEFLGNAGGKVPKAARKILEALPGLFGPPEVLPRARKLDLPALSKKALASLESLLSTLSRARTGLGRVQIDLGEVRGLDYYTGLLFALFAPGASRPLLSGGRYDGLAARFGWDLPAVGFAVDLELLARVGEAAPPDEADLASPDVLLADPQGRAEALLSRAAELRSEGMRVAIFNPSGETGDLEGRVRRYCDAQGIAGAEILPSGRPPERGVSRKRPATRSKTRGEKPKKNKKKKK